MSTIHFHSHPTAGTCPKPGRSCSSRHNPSFHLIRGQRVPYRSLQLSCSAADCDDHIRSACTPTPPTCLAVSSSIPQRISSCTGTVQLQVVVASALASLFVASGAWAADLTATEEVFSRTCAGCHAGGGNVVAAGATLFQGDLQKNGVASHEALYDLIYRGKGKMPGYGINCAPKGACTFAKRLTDEQIGDLADYVLARAAAGWQA